MNMRPFGTRRGRSYPALLTLLGCVAVGFAAWTGTRSPALAAMLRLHGAQTATHGASWAPADIAKPTYTATPMLLPSPTATATIEPTFTPGVAFAEIVADTPTVELAPYSADTTAYEEQNPAGANSGGKYILVDISQQHLYVYQGGVLIYSFVASTGINNATAAGSFSVLSKIPNAYGATWNIWMPNWLGIYWAGGLQNGIHALPILSNGAQLWAGFLGTPISYGCVVLGQYESQLLYDWAEIGTPVDIQW